jgi:hypothetical protein
MTHTPFSPAGPLKEITNTKPKDKPANKVASAKADLPAKEQDAAKSTTASKALTTVSQ